MPRAASRRCCSRSAAPAIRRASGAFAITGFRSANSAAPQSCSAAEGCRDLIFIGTLLRPALSEIRLDWGTIRVLGNVMAAFRGGDDHLLSGIGRILEQDGFRMVGIRDVAPGYSDAGGRHYPRRARSGAIADIAEGTGGARARSVPSTSARPSVVIDGHVVAVEDIEGTDGLLARVARLRAEGRIRAKAGRGVLVKAPKSGQDLRFDLPTVGPQNHRRRGQAPGLPASPIIAGNTIAAESQAMIEAADKAGLFIQGLPA